MNHSNDSNVSNPTSTPTPVRHYDKSARVVGIVCMVLAVILGCWTFYHAPYADLADGMAREARGEWALIRVAYYLFLWIAIGLGAFGSLFLYIGRTKEAS